MFAINDTQYYAQYDFIVDELMVVNNSSVAKGSAKLLREHTKDSPRQRYCHQKQAIVYLIVDNSDVSIRALITNGPGPFNCEPIHIYGWYSETKNASISCLIPNDIVAYNGLSGTNDDKK